RVRAVEGEARFEVFPRKPRSFELPAERPRERHVRPLVAPGEVLARPIVAIHAGEHGAVDLEPVGRAEAGWELNTDLIDPHPERDLRIGEDTGLNTLSQRRIGEREPPRGSVLEMQIAPPLPPPAEPA